MPATWGVSLSFSGDSARNALTGYNQESTVALGSMDDSDFIIRSRRQAQALQLRLDKYRKDRNICEVFPPWFLARLGELPW